VLIHFDLFSFIFFTKTYLKKLYQVFIIIVLIVQTCVSFCNLAHSNIGLLKSLAAGGSSNLAVDLLTCLLSYPPDTAETSHLVPCEPEWPS